MGFFKNIERAHIENELKGQKFIFLSQHKDKIEQQRQKPISPQEQEAITYEWETRFRKWFIENYLIPKYFTNKKGQV